MTPACPEREPYPMPKRAEKIIGTAVAI